MSANITNTPKEQNQDAHFNQRESSLCCTVQMTDNKSSDNKYINHLSDYNTHDISYTGAVFDHLYSLNPDLPIFSVKSDNHSEQFKCCYVLDFGRTFQQLMILLLC